MPINKKKLISEHPRTITISTTLHAPLVTISPSSANLEVCKSQLLSSTVIDGTPPYSYRWYLNDDPVFYATEPAWALTPTYAGSYKVYVEVTDSTGARATSNTATVTVNRRLSEPIPPKTLLTCMPASQNG